jgi:N-formylmethionyl-tRNA deformylase
MPTNPDTVTGFVQYPDPRLSMPAHPLPLDHDLRQTGARLLAVAQSAQAYGLAAAHIGTIQPVVVISVSGPESRDYRLLYNPRILAIHGPEVAGKEGSVSMPGIEVDVIRPESARISFEDEAGARHQLDLTGFAARVAQHEIDQMNGVFFLSRVSRLKRDLAIKRFSKLGRRMG